MPSVLTFRHALYNQAIGGGINVGAGASLANLAAGSFGVWYRPDSISNSARTLAGKLVTGGGWTVNGNNVADGTTLLVSATRATQNHTIVPPTGFLKAGAITFVWATWDINTVANAGMWGALNGQPAVDLSPTIVTGSGSAADDAAQALELLAPVSLANRAFGPVWVMGLWNTPITDLQRIRYWQFNTRPMFGGLVGYWDGEAGGIFVPDKSNQGNHGTGTSVSSLNLDLPYVYTQRLSGFRMPPPRKFILIPN